MPSTPAQIKASKKYYEKTREKWLLYGTEYRNANREFLYEKKMIKQSASPTTYYELNREHLLEKQRGYDKTKQAKLDALKTKRMLFMQLPNV